MSKKPEYKVILKANVGELNEAEKLIVLGDPIGQSMTMGVDPAAKGKDLTHSHVIHTMPPLLQHETSHHFLNIPPMMHSAIKLAGGPEGGKEFIQCESILAAGEMNKNGDAIDPEGVEINLKDMVSGFTDAAKAVDGPPTVKVFCPTGAGGGVNPNCKAGAKGNYTKPIKDQQGRIEPGSVGKLAGVDTSSWPKEKAWVQAHLKKIAKMEAAAHYGHWGKFSKMLSKADKSKPASAKQKLVWKAEEGLIKEHHKLLGEVPEPAVAKPVPPVPTSDGATWKKVGGKLGTEKGGTYELYGEKYYVKIPDNPDRAFNENLAQKLYGMANAGVVDGNIVDINGKKGYATKWEDAAKPSWGQQSIKNKAADDFAVHAWLNNRDAIGAGSENPMDNIKVVKNTGQLKAVDVGGALDYKGGGGGGKKPFGKEAAEWEGLRDPKINPTMAEVFGKMTPDQLRVSAQKLAAFTDTDIENMVGAHGGHLSTTERLVMTQTLKDRRQAIFKKAGLNSKGQYTPGVTDKPKPTTKPSGKDDHDDELPPDYDPIDDIGYDTGPPASSAGKFPGAPDNAPKKPYIPMFKAKSSHAKAETIEAIMASTEMSKWGKIKEIKGIKMPGGKNPTAQAIKQYKKDAIASLKGQPLLPKATGPQTTNYPVKPKPKPAPKPKVQANLLPNLPVFQTSNAKNKAANLADAQKMLDMAKKGNIDGIQALAKGHPSDNLKSWASGLVHNVNSQLTPKPAAKSTASFSAAIAAKASTKAAQQGSKDLGHWMPQQATTAELKSALAVPEGSYLSGSGRQPLYYAGDSATKGVLGRGALKDYTGGHSGYMNDALRDGDFSTMSGKKALKAAAIVFKKGVEIPAGTKLKRFHQGKDMDKSQLQPGKVVADKGLLSTSLRESWSWGGDIQWEMTVGPGVKGIPVDHFSKNKGEDEVVLPPNQRMMIKKVTKSGWKTVVHAVVLPTTSQQCCP